MSRKAKPISCQVEGCNNPSEKKYQDRRLCWHHFLLFYKGEDKEAVRSEVRQ